jgi:acyl-coenzyme A thioesterase PaaI-like protein
MELRTHTKAQTRLVGTPVYLEENARAEVELKTTHEMAVDDHGIVHGGFTFGLADYVAMPSINHPNVVLGASEVRFFTPVEVGDELKAVTQILEEEGKRKKVEL